MALATALMMSIATYRAHSEIRKLDPTSALAQQAVEVALPELEGRGLDKGEYTAEVYTRNSSVYVIFRRALLDEEDDDSRPALTLEVLLSDDASHVIEASFAK